MKLDLMYYYSNTAEQYSFYRIPKALFTDPRFQGVSMEAKLLYGLMLDRMGLPLYHTQIWASPTTTPPWRTRTRRASTAPCRCWATSMRCSPPTRLCGRSRSPAGCGTSSMPPPASKRTST